ncbi:uncharacterized protein PV09_05543 [Verruconis gallopava]|uniref:Rhodopsin domain-containing protein n=1 Tax=Verruconis gallopava TaxID=253628 RepID=A0A0D1XLM4_9PEZI|nr:uncharacterized protein PV09_05543 [Verruconis gallopava]KIW03331.1 hypothetical protein PV09_05543 [Verruconis gallopava]
MAPEVKLTSYFIPISAVEKWPAPNMIDPETRLWLIPMALILEVLASVAVICRIRARVGKLAGGIGADDGLIVASWIFGTAYTALIVFAVSAAGFDRHIWDQNFKVTALGGLIALLAEIAFLISTCATKISILLFYRRLVNGSFSKLLQWSIYVGIAFIVAYLLTFTIFLGVFCSPSSASWQSLDLSYMKPYKCVDRAIVDPLVGIISAASDIYAIVIPEIIVKKLKLPQRRKVILYVIFGAGLVVVVAALIRTGFFIRLHTDPRRDLTWIGYDIFVWTTIELQLAIVYASFPALKSFFLRRGTSNTTTAYGGTTVVGSISKQKSAAGDESPLVSRSKASQTDESATGAKGTWTARQADGSVTVVETMDVISIDSRQSVKSSREARVARVHSFLDSR